MHVLGVQRVRGCFDVISIILDPCIKKWLNMTASKSSCVRVAIPPTVQRIKSVLSEEGHQITNWSCTTPKWLEESIFARAKLEKCITRSCRSSCHASRNESMPSAMFYPCQNGLHLIMECNMCQSVYWCLHTG